MVVTGQRRQRQDFNSPSPITAISGEARPSSAPVAAAASRRPGPTPPPTSTYIPPAPVQADPSRERYDGEEVSAIKLVASEPVSTFSVDVDTGAYANARRFLTGGALPPRNSVRTEELINYFRYDYAAPDRRDRPFSVTTDLAQTPWNPNSRLLRIGLRGYDLPRQARPPVNLVFLLDVSGSMNEPDKLPLVKTALTRLTEQLQPQDKVAIVVYAGAAGLVLPSTSDKAQIRAALNQLNAGGSTAGGAGLRLAYDTARSAMIRDGVNRVILATDGDFNVGISDQKLLVEMIERERDSGVTLTTLGFGTGNFNEAMMEQIANHGNGNYAYIDSALEAEKVLADEMQSTLFTIAKDVKIQVEFNPAQVSQYRLIGYENRALREEDFTNDKVDAGDIGAGHQVTAIYEVVPAGGTGWIAPRRYEGTPPRAGTGGEMAFVKLRYKMPDGTTSREISQAVPAAGLARASLPRGDMAFATAVAAYGQKLRGDPLLAGYSYGQIAELAGSDHRDYWRQEFLKLTSVAGALSPN